MRVRCSSNFLGNLSPAAQQRLQATIRLDGPISELIVGKVYDVWAVERWADNDVRVYLHSIEESRCPYPYPLEMFEVIDPTILDGWCISFTQNDGGWTIQRLSFSAWATDDTFYERLVDDDEAALAAYQSQRMSPRSRFPL